MLSEKDAVSKRRTKHFETFFNVDENREAEIVTVEREEKLHVFRELNDSGITKEEEQKAEREMKSGKTAGLDGCAAEWLKSDGETVVEWLIRLLNICFMNSIRLDECMCGVH